ncbi:hypothetical protein [Haloarcula halobia]|uniref:hypothetical protein n=1 Tax=Haloarcula halobia TaxID=3033388 RepID=UPI0023EDCA68|nr:hypothetical protein [Halomicroarcula sp. XH51]
MFSFDGCPKALSQYARGCLSQSARKPLCRTDRQYVPDGLLVVTFPQDDDRRGRLFSRPSLHDVDDIVLSRAAAYEQAIGLCGCVPVGLPCGARFE